MAPKFTGFYLSLREKRDIIDFYLWQFYAQLLRALKLFQKHRVSINGRQKMLTEELLAGKVSSEGQSEKKDGLGLKNSYDEFVLFQGAYIKSFQDGTLLLKILNFIIDSMGDTVDPLEARHCQYISEGRSRAELRTAYWYIDSKFVSLLPSDYQVAFVDCLLYGEWQIGHPNLIGLHLLALGWMLGAPQFKRFIPPGMDGCPHVAHPIFQHYLPQAGIQIRIGDEQSALAAARRPKSVQQVKKS